MYSQFKNYQFILNRRKKIWKEYKKEFASLNSELITGQINPKNKIIHNYHMYYMIAKSKKVRDRILKLLAKKNIISTFHYIPLHLSFAGKKFGIKRVNLSLTEELSNKIFRLPLWIGINHKYVILKLKEIIKNF